MTRSKIQTIDFRGDSKEVQEKVVKSLRETGFVVLTNHGIPQRAFDFTYEQWIGFFSHPTFKTRFLHDKASQMGYFPMRSETAKGAKNADIKEFYHYFGNSAQKLPPLPITLADFTRATFQEMQALAVDLLKMIERGTPAEFNTCDRPWSNAVMGSESTLLRVLHYPPLELGDNGRAVRAAAHEDINFLTLLPAATQPGLQVLDLDGNWIDVSITDSNSIIVNIGDMLQEASGGYYKSTTHRVVNPGGAANVSRYSMPLFLHASPNTVLSSRHTADSYLKERLKELGLI